MTDLKDGDGSATAAPSLNLCLHLVIERDIALYMTTLVKTETSDLKTTNNYLWIESLVKNKQMNYLWI